MMLVPILGEYIAIPGLADAGNEVLRWGSFIGAFALFLGLFATFRFHGRHISRQTPGQWYFSALVLVSLIVMFASGYIAKDLHTWILNEIWVVAQTAILTTSGFFMFTAIYRAFKAKSLEVVALLLSGTFVGFSIAPIFGAFPILPALGDWVTNVPNLAGQRGIMIGVAIGLIATAVRAILGYETSLFGGGGE